MSTPGSDTVPSIKRGLLFCTDVPRSSSHGYRSSDRVLRQAQSQEDLVDGLAIDGTGETEPRIERGSDAPWDPA